MANNILLVDIETAGLKFDMEAIKAQVQAAKLDTTKKPIIPLGNVNIILDVAKTDNRYIITKRYKGSKLFYRNGRRVCTDWLGKASHFDNFDEAKNHFENVIKSRWVHTKEFQIEPVSNFYLSDWKLVTSNSLYVTNDLTTSPDVILKNVLVSIDEYKRGKKLTDIETMLNVFYNTKVSQDDMDSKSIVSWEANITTSQKKIKERNERFTTLVQAKSIIQNLIDENTSEADKTVKLFYGKE